MPKKSQRLVGLLEKSRKGVLARQSKRDGSPPLPKPLSQPQPPQPSSNEESTPEEREGSPPLPTTSSSTVLSQLSDSEEFSSQSSSTSHYSQSAVPSELEAADSEFLIVRRQELVQLLRQAGAVCKDCMMEYKLVAERKTVQKTPLLSGIPFEKMNVIQSLYADLASPELLQKCLKGRTQNVNESLHGRVWKKVSKDKYAGLFRTTFACEATILNHNFKKDLHFLSSLGFPVSQHSLDVLHRQDGVTKRSMRQSSTPRKRRKVVETKADDSYSSGAH
ncbi:hypothetical protein Pcinc_010963 [Petrolisthes cinctipes]|uniref:Uncharacterized protein n=1 Tax=Petrolisthes cinctipes TaxID=88211 RepID=A0AAE1G4H0_PETCI|nr:hypothetical protein Pcinc_010963 [Petrolisthes cinctipes]